MIQSQINQTLNDHVNPALHKATEILNDKNVSTIVKVALIAPSLFLAYNAFIPFAVSLAIGAAARNIDFIGDQGKETISLFNSIMNQLQEKRLDFAGFAVLSVLAPTVSLMALTAVHGYNLTDTFFSPGKANMSEGSVEESYSEG